MKRATVEHKGALSVQLYDQLSIYNVYNNAALNVARNVELIDVMVIQNFIISKDALIVQLYDVLTNSNPVLPNVAQNGDLNVQLAFQNCVSKMTR